MTAKNPAETATPQSGASKSAAPKSAAPLRPVTQRTISQEFGISVSTVSRVLNDPETASGRWASPDLVERIIAFAQKHGYHRNPHAASLRTSRSNLIGVLVPRLQDFVLATIYEGIEEAATERDISSFVTNSLDLPANQLQRTRMMLDRRVDGLIFGDAHLDDPFLDDLAAEGVNFVLASRRAGDHTSVTCDDVRGGELVAEHLLAIGRTDVAILAGREYASTSIDRTRGLVERLAKDGITVRPDWIMHDGFDAAGGRESAEKIFASGDFPNAVFATNDFAAIGAIGVMRDHGLSVPDDVALIGYNDTPLAAEIVTPLTTVHSPMHEMGRRALGLLLDKIAGAEVDSLRLEPELIVRASTRVSGQGSG